MARTKRPVASANLDARAHAVTQVRTMLKIAALRRVTRVLSSQEARALPSPKHERARVPSEKVVDSSDSEAEAEGAASATRSALVKPSGMRRERAAARRLLRRRRRRRRMAGRTRARAAAVRGHDAARAFCSLRTCDGSALVRCRGDAAGRAGGGRGHVDARMDGRRAALAVAPEGARRVGRERSSTAAATRACLCILSVCDRCVTRPE